jgi:hypothetical protein
MKTNDSGRGFPEPSALFGRMLIGQHTVTGDVDEIKIANIPQNFNHLEIFANVMGNGNTGYIALHAFFNEDRNDGNYRFVLCEGQVTSAGSSINTFGGLLLGGDTLASGGANPAVEPSYGRVIIPFYNTRHNWKSWRGESWNNRAGGGYFWELFTGSWHNTSPIQSMVFTTTGFSNNSTKFTPPTKVFLYGVM